MDLATSLIQKYFPPEQWANAKAVMMGESGGNPSAIGDNYPIRGETIPSYGLFQIRGLPGRPDSSTLLDPEKNVAYAANMQKQQGWSPWTAARNLGIVGAGMEPNTTINGQVGQSPVGVPNGMNGAKGVILRDSQGNQKQVTWDELQSTDPWLYSKYVGNVGQPQASLQQTQAGIPGVVAESSLRTTEAQGVDAMKNAATALKMAQDKEGKVSPEIYNTIKNNTVGATIPSEQFDKAFESQYVDPTKPIEYNTTKGFEAKSAFGEIRRQVHAQIDAYNSIPEDQKGLISKSAVEGVPLIGQQLQQLLAPQALEYEKNIGGLSAQLRELAGGAGIRVSQTELDRWANLLPSPRKTEIQNGKDLQILDSQIKAAFNTDIGIDPKYLSSNNMQQSSQRSGQTNTQGNTNINTNSVGGGNTSNGTGGNPYDKFFGGLLNNALSDTGEIASRVSQIPTNAIKSFQENPIVAINKLNPLAPNNLGVDIGKGIISEGNQLLGKPFEGGNFAERALQRAYEKPVTTALDVLPFLQAGKATMAGKVDATAAEGKSLATIGDSTKIVPKTDAINWIKQNFTIPTKRAGVNDLKTVKTGQELLAHINSGMDQKILQEAPSMITGDEGIVTNMTRDAVAKIPGEIDITKATGAAKNILDRTRGLSPNDVNTVLSDIRKAQNIAQGANPGKLNIQDAYDQARYLQNQGWQEARQNTYLSPNIQAQKIGQAYNSAASEILDEIEKAGKNSNVLEQVKTPERIAQLRQISPRLASQITSAQKISDLRSAAAPFVKLGQMQDLTDSVQASVGHKVAESATGGKITPLTYLGASHNPIMGILGRVGDKILEPTYRRTMGIGEQINSKAINPLYNMLQYGRFAPNGQNQMK